MAAQPIITFRSSVAPYAALTSLAFQDTFYGTVFPILNGNSSDVLTFRIYNNFGLSAGISNALNVTVSVYDQAAATSASTAPASQMWTHIFEDMYGESTAGVSYGYTSYAGTDTPIGGTNSYAIEQSSDGSNTRSIRAGTNTNGLGFIEFNSYLTPPNGVTAQSYSFAVVCSYQWIT